MAPGARSCRVAVSTRARAPARRFDVEFPRFARKVHDSAPARRRMGLYEATCFERNVAGCSADLTPEDGNAGGYFRAFCRAAGIPAGGGGQRGETAAAGFFRSGGRAFQSALHSARQNTATGESATPAAGLGVRAGGSNVLLDHHGNRVVTRPRSRGRRSGHSEFRGAAGVLEFVLYCFTSNIRGPA